MSKLSSTKKSQDKTCKRHPIKSTDEKKAKGKFVVGNDRGLHTRPSTELVKCASSFKSHILLSFQKHLVNAKSLLGIIMLTATKGSTISVEAFGDDADEAVNSILALARNNFNIKY